MLQRRKLRPYGDWSFVEDHTLELNFCGGSRYIECEVEYAAKPGYGPDDTDPGCGPEIEIIDVRPYYQPQNEAGTPRKPRVYLDVPARLMEDLKEAIEDDHLHPDFDDDDF